MPIHIKHNHPVRITIVEDTEPSLGRPLDRSEALTIQ
jgi:hypothetical protein